MTPVESVLAALNNRYDLVASLVVNRDGRLLGRAGDFEPSVANDPYNLFFRDHETIANTFDFVEQSSPRSLAQGQRQVTVFKVRPDVVLGIIKDDPRGAVEMHHLTVKLQQELQTLFANLDLDVA